MTTKVGHVPYFLVSVCLMIYGAQSQLFNNLDIEFVVNGAGFDSEIK